MERPLADEVLRTRGLAKRYRRFSLEGVNMTVLKGEIYGLVGRNGAGKTTLLRLLADLARPSAGALEILGSPNLCAQRRKIGCLIERPSLYGHMTAIQNLGVLTPLLAGDLRIGLSDALEIVGLANAGAKKVRHFSLGMRQRLAIAMAIIGSPELLILDEPANGLDPVGIRDLRDLISRLNKELGMAVVVSSHQLAELSKLATSYGVIDNGRLVVELRGRELEDLRGRVPGLEAHLVSLMGGGR
jgi:ABC-2 type transport system ATP-binding protein